MEIVGAVVVVELSPPELAATILSVRDCVAEPAEFCAVTVNVYLPVAVGVPEITPALLRVSPVGRLPDVTDHVMGVVPVEDKTALYAVPDVPEERLVVVIAGLPGTVGAAIVIVKELDALPTEFVACTVNVNVPVAVGVPEISPEALSVRPPGSAPLVRLHEIVGAPAADSEAV